MMVKKKTSKKKETKKKQGSSKKKGTSKDEKLTSKENVKKFPTLKFQSDRDIALDFATKVYKKFDKMIKSIVLFGSAAKKTAVSGSDIDIVIILDDVSIKWDQELIAWYREELGKTTRANPYIKNIHINTVKLSTWWEDLMRGDPVLINIIRYGEPLIDFGGFFEPLKYLLVEGKIKSTPESIVSLLQRAPQHFARSKVSELNSIEGLYWAMVDSAHAALISINISPPSPEHIPMKLNEHLVNSGKLKKKYVNWYREVFDIHKKITHGEITDLKGVEIDDWQSKTDEFMNVMAKLVDDTVED